MAGFVFTSISQSLNDASIMKSRPNNQKQNYCSSGPLSSSLSHPSTKVQMLDQMMSTQRYSICCLRDFQMEPSPPCFLYSSSMYLLKDASETLLPSSCLPQSWDCDWIASLVRWTSRLEDWMSNCLLDVRMQHYSQQQTLSCLLINVTSIQLRTSNFLLLYRNGTIYLCRTTLLVWRLFWGDSAVDGSSRLLSSPIVSVPVWVTIIPLPLLEFSPGLMIQCSFSSPFSFSRSMMGWVISLSSQLSGRQSNTSLFLLKKQTVKCLSKFFLSLMHLLRGKWL